MGSVSFRKLAVFGVGLIGGSFALALKQAGMVERVVGVGRGRANIDRALELGVIDEAAEQAAEAIDAADLVLVAVPVRQMDAVFAGIAPHLRPDAAITDGGSTKRDVITAAAALGEKFGAFVPAHPIAGGELSGVEAASAELYRGRTVVITPLPQTDARARTVVDVAWRACGAKVVEMTPQRHDEVLGAVSHLPHALAFAMMHMIAQRRDTAELLSFAGAGFRDFTRIASSSPEMWRDICLANRDVLAHELRAYGAHLDAFIQLLQNHDGAALERAFMAARAARNDWLAERKVSAGEEAG
ncbi:MAG: prephenate dehydrogenase/arogenate dehydrogenase family protein [Proteobacteria bacterium]|nr:MAG: prephenate dehydrogenase/arogenate dehydrogenase family protein [Pseudomonadota bacterium]